MDDAPPPKKKSRFFSNGKSKIGGILPSKKGSETDDSPQTNSTPSLPSSSNNKANSNNSSHSPSATNPIIGQGRSSHRESPRQLLSDSDAETDIDESENGKQDRGWGSRSDEENTKPASSTLATPDLDKLSIRNKRRDGVYGLGSLLPQQQPNSGPSQPPPPPPFQPSLPTTLYVDMDRDEHGRLLPNPPPFPRDFGGLGPGTRAQQPLSAAYNYSTTRNRIEAMRSFQPAPYLANPESLVPEHLYMSPHRLERASRHARISSKRKRPENIFPPPPYVYQRTSDPNFNIFNGVLLYPELVFALASVLPVKDLISLYAISRDFHTILDTRFTTVVLTQAMNKAPESARTFVFRSYSRLSRTDPATQIPHPRAALAARHVPRLIPSFRWLKMIIHREKVVHEIMAVFAEDGIPLPFRCRLALKRLWYLLDVPDNARRIGLVHNRRLLTDLDIFFAMCFFVKLDMRLNDPVASEKHDDMRKLLMSQKSLTTVLRVLRRDLWTTRLDILREWVKLKYTPAEDEQGLSIFGIPPEQVGRGRLEYWGERTATQLGREPEILLRPDQLIIREAIRRRMTFKKMYIRFMTYGYVRPDTLVDYAPRQYGRRIVELEDEYEIDDTVGGVAALGVGDEGYDELLDLGPTRNGSQYTIVKEETSEKDKEMRKEQEGFLKWCLAWWEREAKGLAPDMDLG
ncbi:uncharacterized protein Z518_00716 [Rhinocladiella mackenziei CBS 650.93]|uniref:F-box domain-containing protein n=1 Tax=Rhinocladiella mackenziei CBS 650.93 TaxID=1442369 RepID=A0A0D2JJM0_9EURO|nr:uncharacterized protein Z518_00716 [Rhinocladiella mackenziei CBS 650.93]KIX09635.1 hypothetical protein Z518_00716 [Rhinocladiella mackenziei CBS 650.93]